MPQAYRPSPNGPPMPHDPFKHLDKIGRVTVSGHLGDDMPKGTLASVRRQAGLKELRSRPYPGAGGGPGRVKNSDGASS